MRLVNFWLVGVGVVVSVLGGLLGFASIALAVEGDGGGGPIFWGLSLALAGVILAVAGVALELWN